MYYNTSEVKGKMAEKLSVQQTNTLNVYLKAHPNVKREDAIKLLFNNSAQKPTGKGVSVEHNKDNSEKPETIYLQSGRKVVYTRTKDGKLACKYYGADGTQIKPEYFKLVEGQISIGANNDSYTITKNGKSVKYKAKNSRKGQIDQNIAKLNNHEKSLKVAKAEQGVVGKGWDWVKNSWVGQKMNLDGSAKAQKQIEEERKLLIQLRDNPDAQIDSKKFEKITGQKYTKANLTKFQQGEFSSAKAKVEGYKEGQKVAVDVASDLVSGVASFGIYTASIAAAPFTGGVSLAVGFGAATAVGAGIKVGIKYLDAKTGGRKYDSLGSDIIMGSVNGGIAPFTAGVGGATAKTIAVRTGIQVVKQGGKQAAKQVISQTTKAAAKKGFARTFKANLKESILQPNNYKLVGGSFKNRLAAYAAEGVVDGGLSGGAYSGVETAKNGGSAGDIAKATLLGTVMGAGMGGIMTSAVHGKGVITGNKSKSGKEVVADAVETSLTKNADDVVPTPKPQGANEIIQETLSASTPTVMKSPGSNFRRTLTKIRDFLGTPVDEPNVVKMHDLKFDVGKCTSEEKSAVIKALRENEEFINIIKSDPVSGFKGSDMTAEVRLISTSSKTPEYRIFLNDKSDPDVTKIIDFRVDETGKINLYQLEKVKVIDGIDVSANHVYTNKDNDFTRITENTQNNSILKEVRTKDKELVYRFIIEDSEIRPGEAEITITKPDKYGNLIEDKVGTVKVYEKVDKNGNHEVIHARRRVEASDGTKSRQIKVFGKDRHGTTYKVLDKDGNVQLDIKRSHRKISENHYRSSHNGERFDIKYEDDGITVSFVEGTGANERLVKPVKISYKELDPQLMDLYKQLPGDYLYKLKIMGVKVKYSPEPKYFKFVYEDRSYYSPKEKTIFITDASKNNPEVFAHEYAHAIDDYLKLNTDSEYLRLSKQDWETFSKNSGIKEKHEIAYYTQNLDPTDYNPDVELIAGVNQVIGGFSDSECRQQIGDAILFQNYSKTIAYVGKKLEMPIEEFAKASKKSG